MEPTVGGPYERVKEGGMDTFLTFRRQRDLEGVGAGTSHEINQRMNGREGNALPGNVLGHCIVCVGSLTLVVT